MLNLSLKDHHAILVGYLSRMTLNDLTNLQAAAHKAAHAQLNGGTGDQINASRGEVAAALTALTGMLMSDLALIGGIIESRINREPTGRRTLPPKKADSHD